VACRVLERKVVDIDRGLFAGRLPIVSNRLLARSSSNLFWIEAVEAEIPGSFLAFLWTLQQVQAQDELTPLCSHSIHISLQHYELLF
jgi:hypothetical protein